MGVKVTLKYDGKMFDGIEKKVASRHLKKYMTQLTSGTSGNPLYAHWTEGQTRWQEDDEEYSKWKKNRFGSDDKFKLTGAALKAIKGKPGAIKKVRVSYRKKGQYFLLTAGIQKMEEGRNVYGIAQKGRFGGLSYTSGGEKKEVSAHQYLQMHETANKAWQQLQDEGVDRGKIKRHAFKNKVIEKSLGMDAKSSKRISRNERLITANLPGDEKFVKDAEMAPLLETIIKESGYTLK